jgi:hypothetical protein
MEISRNAIRILLAGTFALLLLAIGLRPAASLAADHGPRIQVASAHAVTPAAEITQRSTAKRSNRVNPVRPTPVAPAPAPAPTPAPRNPLLFSSNFTKALEGWSLAGVGEVIPQVIDSPEGPYCEFTLAGSQGRSELIMGDNLHVVEGETVSYEFEEFIVPGFAYGSRSLGWNLFTQFKSDGEGSPMLALDLWNEGGKKGLWVEPESSPYFVSPMAEGVWHRVGMQISASSKNGGGWTIYLDGQEVDHKTGVSTIRPGKAFAYIKNGLYRSGPTINATSKLRLRNVSLTAVG